MNLFIFESSKNFITWIIFYPFVIRCLYLIRQFFNPSYMNSNCLLELVKDSAPNTWNNHVLWPHFNITESCSSIFEITLDDFFISTFHTGKIENNILYFYLFALLICGVYYLMSQLIIKKNIQVISSFFGCFIVSWLQGSLFHLISHYQNDITHLNGNVMHHSEYKINGDNTSITNTLPSGLIFVFILNYTTVLWIMYLITKKLGIDSKMYCAYATIIIPIKQIFQMVIIHPYIHTYNKSWYPWPLNLMFKDYEGHVLCHHINGLCLGDFPGVGYIYNLMLQYHSKLFSGGYIKFKSINYFILNIIIDYILYSITIIICSLLCFSFFYFLPKTMKNKKN